MYRLRYDPSELIAAALSRHGCLKLRVYDERVPLPMFSDDLIQVYVVLLVTVLTFARNRKIRFGIDNDLPGLLVHIQPMKLTQPICVLAQLVQ